jgi:hypothetical protein
MGDVLVSTVFQSFPGVERSAMMTFNKEDLVWNAESASRATAPCSVAAIGVGCLGATRNTTTVEVDLLNDNELFGERISLFDLKIAKNIRFGTYRATIGADIYNVLNSDAIQDYNNDYILDDPATAENEQVWGEPSSLVSPRFLRFSLQFYF